MNTLKVKSTHKESQGEYVIINETDFDKAVHELYEDEAEVAQPKGAAKAEGGTETVTPKATGKGKGAAKA